MCGWHARGYFFTFALMLEIEEKKFTVTTALQKLYKLEKRVKIVQGGSSAGKTFSILPILINRAIENENVRISVVSESVPHLRRGALSDFESIMRMTGRWIEGSFNKALLTYHFQNGSRIEFFSADQPDKLRGARREILFINEANNIVFDSYQQLAMRTNSEIWLDFNPVAEFWAHTELMDEDDSEFIILTYKDNEALDKDIVTYLEKAEKKAETSEYWKNWVQVYVYGKIGQLQGAVYENWSRIREVPKEAKLLGYGLDFGFANDPCALVAIYKHDSKVIVHEMVYKTELTNSDLDKEFKRLGVRKDKVIYADSAEPKSIEELKRYGWMIKPTKKGADSIRFGIDTINGLNGFKVTKSSINLIKELRNYIWDRDSFGNVKKRPIDAYNHCLDAFRYYAMMRLGKKRKFTMV